MKSSAKTALSVDLRLAVQCDERRTTPQLATATPFFTRQTRVTESAMRGDCYDE